MVTRDIGSLIICRCQLRRPEKIVIPRRIQVQISHPFVVNENVVQIPQVDVRQFVSQDALYLGQYSRILAMAGVKGPDGATLHAFASSALSGRRP